MIEATTYKSLVFSTRLLYNRFVSDLIVFLSYNNKSIWLLPPDLSFLVR
jgi:hypothetical protein